MTPYVISQVQDLVSVYDVRQISEIILELNQVNIQIQTKDSEFYIKNNKKLSLISSEFEDYQLKIMMHMNILKLQWMNLKFIL